MTDPYHGHKLTPEQEAEMAELLAIDEATRPAIDAALETIEQAEAAAKEAAAAERYAQRQAASYAWQKRRRAQGPADISPTHRSADIWQWADGRRRILRTSLRPRVPCKAHRPDGRPCEAWAIQGGFVCWAHGGASPQVQAAARARLAGEGLAEFVAAAQARMRAAGEAHAAAAAAEYEAELARLDADAAAARRRAPGADGAPR